MYKNSLSAMLRPAMAILAWAWAVQSANAAAPTPLPISALFAGQASYINNAETQPVGQPVAEDDLTYTHNPESDYVEYPLTLTCGLLPRWDLSAAIGGQWQASTQTNGSRHTACGFSDIPVYTKIKLLDQEDWWCSQSVEFRIKLPTASRAQGLGTGFPDYDATWVLSKDLTSKLSADLNLGYTWLGRGDWGPYAEQLHYGAALEYAATEKLGLLAQCLTSEPGSQMRRTEVALSAGMSWQMTHRLQFHGELVKGIGSGSRIIDYSATIGVTWTFGKLPAAAKNAGAQASSP